MTVQVEYFPMVGGLDIVSPYYTLTSGTMIECGNYECLPEGGYRRIDGYEIYDGSEAPAAIPGAVGVVRGTHVYDGELYAVVDTATAGGLFKESASGWTAVSLGTSLNFVNGEADFIEGTTVLGVSSGATGVIDRVVFSGGTNGAMSSFGRLTISSVSGTFTAGEDLTVGAVKFAEADAAQYANALPKGGKYTFTTANFFGQDGDERMYAANGVGDPFEFDGTVFTSIPAEASGTYPSYVLEHKRHLFLAYSQGSIVTSSIGLPLTFDALLGAAEIAVGDAVVGLHPLPGGIMATLCKDTIQMLYGNDSTTWQLQQFTAHGAKAFSFGEVGGNTLVLDDRGVQNIRTSDAYGDFTATSQSRKINPLILDSETALVPTATMVSKIKSQYRLFFGKTGYYFTYTGENLVGATVVQFDHTVETSAVGEDSDGKEITYFGSTDGQVFKANTGFNFNGGEIVAFFRIAFNFAKAPTSQKQYRKAVLDIQSEGESAQIFVKADYDFKGLDVPATGSHQIDTTVTGGGTWDFSDWDEFNWDSPFYAIEEVTLAGIARNMSLSFISPGEVEGGHTIYSAAIHYSMRRLNR